MEQCIFGFSIGNLEYLLYQFFYLFILWCNFGICMILVISCLFDSVVIVISKLDMLLFVVVSVLVFFVRKFVDILFEVNLGWVRIVFRQLVLVVILRIMQFCMVWCVWVMVLVWFWLCMISFDSIGLKLVVIFLLFRILLLIWIFLFVGLFSSRMFLIVGWKLVVVFLVQMCNLIEWLFCGMFVCFVFSFLFVVMCNCLVIRLKFVIILVMGCLI